MLNPSDKERLASLEADIPWIREALGRLELGQKEVRKLVEDHLIRPRNNSSGTNGKNGITITIGRKTIGAIIALPGLWAFLQSLGVV